MIRVMSMKYNIIFYLSLKHYEYTVSVFDMAPTLNFSILGLECF